MARRIYKGCTIEHRLNLPVSNIDDLEYLSILLHTKEDNDIIKTYPNDIAFKNDEFVFTISSDDIVFLQEGILWATIDMRVSGVDTNKKIQLPYYIKYREGAASSTLVTIEEVEAIVDEKIVENVDETIDTKIDEKFGVLLDDVESNTNNINTLRNKVSALESIDHSQYLTEHQPLKTINGESIVGDGNIIIEGDGTVVQEYDDTELRNRIEALEQKEDKDTIYDDTELRNKVSALEGIDHSQYLTEHQPLKTINGESIVGDGNIVIESGEGGTGGYDDTELRNRIEALEQKEDKDTIYDDTELKNRVSALEQKEDKDTIYDDTAVRNLITNLSNRLTTVEGKGYLTAADLKTINNNSLVGEGNISIEADYETIYNALDQI